MAVSLKAIREFSPFILEPRPSRTVYQYSFMLTETSLADMFPSHTKFIRKGKLDKLRAELRRVAEMYRKLKKRRLDLSFEIDMGLFDAGNGSFFVGFAVSHPGQRGWYEDFLWDLCDKNIKVCFPETIQETEFSLVSDDKILARGSYPGILHLADITGYNIAIAGKSKIFIVYE